MAGRAGQRRVRVTISRAWVEDAHVSRDSMTRVDQEIFYQKDGP